MVADYVPDPFKGFANMLVAFMSFGTFAGLMYLNMFDVGICQGVKMIWSL